MATNKINEGATVNYTAGADISAGDIVPAIAEVFTTPPPEAHRAGT